MLTDEPFEPVSAETINRWFDYWVLQDAKGRGDSRSETINAIRALALSGTKRGARNKRAMQSAIAAELRKMANTIEGKQKE